ncbi:MAG: hypothetical protein R3344_08550 [Acidobacteriota bacterium]|nr:hypothetical protein [Acidobacteriota bacterium]
MSQQPRLQRIRYGVKKPAKNAGDETSRRENEAGPAAPAPRRILLRFQFDDPADDTATTEHPDETISAAR